MAINLGGGFHIGSKQPIDDRLIMSKAQMLNINENTFPDVYMCICNDDGAIYTFNINNEANDETGKFRMIEGSADCYTKAEIDTKLRPLLYEAPKIFITADQTNYQYGDVADITLNITVYAGNEKITRIFISSPTLGNKEITNFSSTGMTSTTVTFEGVTNSSAFYLRVVDELKTNSVSTVVEFSQLSYCLLIPSSYHDLYSTEDLESGNFNIEDIINNASLDHRLILDSKEYKWYVGRSIGSVSDSELSNGVMEGYPENEATVYIYPKKYGALEVITDGGFNYINGGFYKSEHTYNDTEYYCYVASAPTSLPNYDNRLFWEFK